MLRLTTKSNPHKSAQLKLLTSHHTHGHHHLINPAGVTIMMIVCGSMWTESMRHLHEEGLAEFSTFLPCMAFNSPDVPPRGYALNFEASEG